MEPATYQRMAEIQDRHWWYEGRRRILRSLIGNLGLPAGAQILEVGCGPGANLEMLKEFGSVAGMEPDDFARARAGKISGCPVKKGFLPHDIPFTGPFDMIGAFDVIEHVEEDAASIKALHGLTKPGGYALFTVPAYMFLWSLHDERNHHKRRYVLPQFRALLEGGGYRVEFISYYNTFLLPLVAGVRFLKNMLKITDSPDEELPGAAVNRILLAVFSLEKNLLKFFPLPAGVSIVAVCRRA